MSSIENDKWMTEVEQAVLDTAPVHGYLANPSWAPPRKIVHCLKPQRESDCAKAAHEYEEEEEVFCDKIRLLAQICINGKDILAYTGAGISTAAGIYDYASKSAGKISQVAKMVKDDICVTDLRPTHAHHILTRMYQAGLLHHWIQQNHDCLPQKAGFPQHAINEIHGSWSDPSNRVINFDEDFRPDLLRDLEMWKTKAYVCLTIGTSLSNMTADCVVSQSSRRGKSRFQRLLKKNPQLTENWADNLAVLSALGGAVIVGFQCTSLDSAACLRIYSNIEKVFDALAQEFIRLFPVGSVENNLFSVPIVDQHDWLRNELSTSQEFANGRIIKKDVYELWNYDESTGKLKNDRHTKKAARKRLLEDEEDEEVDEIATKLQKTCIKLDLRLGTRIVIVCGLYDKGCTGTVTGKNDVGNYLIRLHCMRKCKLKNGKTEKRMGYSDRIFGLWNIKSALEGKLEQFPLFNEVF